MSWKFTQDRPIYLQIMDYIMIDMFSGKYKAGEKIESVRDLALKAGVNPNTMQKALQEMENLNLLISKRTTGRYISDNQEAINKFREKIAKERTKTYTNDLKNMGYSISEIEKFISEESEN